MRSNIFLSSYTLPFLILQVFRIFFSFENEIFYVKLFFFGSLFTVIQSQYDIFLTFVMSFKLNISKQVVNLPFSLLLLFN